MRPWCAVALLACAVPRGGRASFVAIDPSVHAARLGDDYEWAVRSVPFVELAADDDVVAAFYYRWRVLRKHVTWTGAPDGYVITEFLREVSWAGLHNTIPAAAGHHLREARWLRNATAASDYARFWFAGTGAAPASYTSWIGHAAWALWAHAVDEQRRVCLLYTSPSPRD